MRALVTGGAGFIGGHLVDRLVGSGHEVTVVDSLVPQVHRGGPGHRNPGAPYVIADLLDEGLLPGLLAEHDVVYHLAALVGVGQSMYEVERYVRGNSLATARLLEALARGDHGVRRLVVAGSMSSYGEGQYVCEACGPFAPDLRDEAQLAEARWEVLCPRCGDVARPVPTPEDKPLRATSVYAATKREQEELALVLGRAYGLPTVVLRFFNVYGPRQSLSNPYTGVAAIFSSRVKNGQPPVVYEDGLQTRDFVHVSDVSRALELAGTRSGGAYQALNVGTGQATSVKALAELIAKLHGSDLRPEVQHRYRSGDIRHCIADPRRIEAVLGWRATVSLDEGLRNLASWAEVAPAEDHFLRAEGELAGRGLIGRPAGRQP